MTSFAIILVVASAALHAMRELFTKKSGDKQVFIWWYKGFSLVLFLPICAYYLINGHIPTSTALWIAALSGLAHFIYWVVLAKAYDHGGDLSHVYPIMRSSPAFILLASVLFLGEQVSVLGVIGIIITTIGVYMNNLKTLSLKSVFTPITSLFSEKQTRYAFFTLMGVIGYSVIDKIGVSHVHPVVFLCLFTFFSLVFYTPVIAATKTKEVFWKEWYVNKRAIMLNGLFSITSYYLVLVAFTMTNLSYVDGLRQLSVVFAVLLGGKVLKEKNQYIRLLAASIIFIGAILISLAV